MNMSVAIGMDIGGTNIRLALVSKDGSPLQRKKVVVGGPRGEEDILAQLSQVVADIKKEASLSQPIPVGIGVPGIVSSPSGVVYSSPHYPSWENFALRQRLEDSLHCPITIDNDANMIAKGELWQGAAKDWEHFLMVTLGTGIGGALVIHSRIFHGNNGFAGEIGHMVLEAEGPPCACGSHGCFETFASASGLRRMVGEAIADEEFPGTDELEKIFRDDPSQLAFHLSALARKGNQIAGDIFKHFGYYLGIGLASAINATGIQNVVVGGGLIGSQDLFLTEAKTELKQRTYRETARKVEIRLAQLGDDAGILGSAVTVLENMA